MYLETSDRRSLFHDRARQRLASSPRPRSARTPPPAFLFLPIHLSNSPGARMPPTLRRTEEPTKLRHPRTAGWRFTVPVRSFRGASSRRNAVAGADGSYIGGGSIHCQPRNSKDLRQTIRGDFRQKKAASLSINMYLAVQAQTAMP